VHGQMTSLVPELHIRTCDWIDRFVDEPELGSDITINNKYI